MAKLVILLACVAVFNAVSALDCYTCTDDACKKDVKEMQKVTCGKPADQNQESVCQKVTYKGKDGKEHIERKCAYAPKNGEAQCPASINKADVTDLKCPSCKADLCNSATTINFSLTAFAAVVFAIVGQKFLM
ncbi:uncharacterized protein LOC126888888 [Diabrotica virgifera virgifera]|uniref:Protein sleepless n=1 Tax=Diabrotica virgifera virgifera TaxID=50390 RepID=A0ABM5KSW3_DIAVI|nr:uncharacterized protein LOC126888888 [Diabrotica virgifera virgifera]